MTSAGKCHNLAALQRHCTASLALRRFQPSSFNRGAVMLFCIARVDTDYQSDESRREAVEKVRTDTRTHSDGEDIFDFGVALVYLGGEVI